MELINFKSLNRYKEKVHEEVEYDAPKIILNRIGDLESERKSLSTQLSKLL
jgi:type I restriction enzyme M protein